MAPPIATRTPKGRPTTDHPNSSPVPAPGGRTWLNRLFAGELVLPGLAPAALPVADRAAAEADAVSRALACPDLFVVDAADRSARARVIADLARAAAARGERVLVLSPDPAAADRLAEAVAAPPPQSVVRALADDENPHRPSPAVSRLTSAAAGAGRVDRMKRDAAAEVARWEAALAQVAAAADRLERARELQARSGVLDGERADLARRLDAIAAEAHDEADGKRSSTELTEAVARLRADHDAAAATLAADRAAAAALHGEKDATLATLRQHLAETAGEGGRKPGFFARLLGKPKHAADPADLDRQAHDLEREVKDLADRVSKLGAEIDAAAGRFAAEREKRITEAVAARRAELETRLRGIDAEKERVGRELGELFPDTPPADPGACQTNAECELAAARGRLEELTRSGSELVRRFLGEMAVVVGTPGSLAVDPVFEPAPGQSTPQFDLLVLDHAEELTESDFTRLSRLAGRWVLVGDVARADAPRPSANGPLGRHARPPEPTFVARLARLLDREPWAVEGGRLVFRLAHLTPAQRRELVREPVLDRPEVELRMATDAAGDPVLAEIAFPAAAPVAEAKAFLFAQLGEVLLRPCGEREWHPTTDRLTARWPGAEAGAPAAAWVGLEPGVQELVAGTGAAAFTAGVAFDRAAGWDEEKAAEWLAARLPAASTGRVAVLPRPAGHGASPHRPVASA